MTELFSSAQANEVDKVGVHEAYERWPSLAREGFEVKVELDDIKVNRAFVLAMGGSASGGDIISGWLSDRPGVEVAVFKGQLPIGDLRGTISVACSASGQTEETIQMLRTAVQRHANVISISGGGKLREVSASLGVPHIDMPRGVAPRYMLPFIIFSTLAVLNRGLGLQCEEEAKSAISAMEAEGKGIGLAVPTSENGAKRLALTLLEKTPCIYGARVTRGVGIRFKNVLNENSKKHAHFDGIPDAFHNEIEAWQDPSVDFAPVFLRHSSEGERDRQRADIMFDILSKAGKNPVEVRGRVGPSLGQLVSMVYRLDVASYYTAIGLGRNPFPTDLIDALKRSG